MSLFPLFESAGSDREPPRLAAKLAPKLRRLADQGVFIGTSSWKYEGWLGSIYSPENYFVRGKLSDRKFQDSCLTEYAETFPVVGGDFSFYQFPSAEYWRKLYSKAPNRLLFGLKVPEDITVHSWPGHARYGARAGKINDSFLDATLLKNLFLERLRPHLHHVGVVMFEFGTLNKSAFATPSGFCNRLRELLRDLPEGFRYGVEIRNSEYLGDAYFQTLREFNVAHVINGWTRMPEIAAQIELPGVLSADFTVVRALLKKGRTYEQAVDRFSPYNRVQEENPAGRSALRKIVSDSLREERQAYVFVNNRYEGCAPETIDAVTDEL